MIFELPFRVYIYSRYSPCTVCSFMMTVVVIKRTELGVDSCEHEVICSEAEQSLLFVLSLLNRRWIGWPLTDSGSD